MFEVIDCVELDACFFVLHIIDLNINMAIHLSLISLRDLGIEDIRRWTNAQTNNKVMLYRITLLFFRFRFFFLRYGTLKMLLVTFNKVKEPTNMIFEIIIKRNNFEASRDAGAQVVTVKTD